MRAACRHMKAHADNTPVNVAGTNSPGAHLFDCISQCSDGKVLSPSLAAMYQTLLAVALLLPSLGLVRCDCDTNYQGGGPFIIVLKVLAIDAFPSSARFLLARIRAGRSDGGSPQDGTAACQFVILEFVCRRKRLLRQLMCSLQLSIVFSSCWHTY